MLETVKESIFRSRIFEFGQIGCRTKGVEGLATTRGCALDASMLASTEYANKLATGSIEGLIGDGRGLSDRIVDLSDPKATNDMSPSSIRC